MSKYQTDIHQYFVSQAQNAPKLSVGRGLQRFPRPSHSRLGEGMPPLSPTSTPSAPQLTVFETF